MRKPFFSRLTDAWEKRRGFRLPVWIGFHLLILGGALLLARLEIKSDLTSILPETSRLKTVATAEKMISDAASSRFSLLVGHADFTVARRAAVELAVDLRRREGLAGIRVEIDPSSLDRLQEFTFRYRYQFLADDVRALLEKGDTADLSAQAFLTLAGPLSLGGLDHLDLDPFLIGEVSLRQLLASGLQGGLRLGLRDGVLSASYDGREWVLVTGTTARPGLSVQTNDHPAAGIRQAMADTARRNTGVRIVVSGVPFHTYESATAAQSEISLLSILSTMLIIALILFIFRSLKPLVITLGAIAVGIATGLAAALLVFRELHLLTIVFGTSIIGISIDYALHFFATESTLSAGRPRGEVIRLILPGISLGLVTTLASYVGFLFTGFPLLQQMALFSMVGLASCFLSVILVFPALMRQGRVRSSFPAAAGAALYRGFSALQRLPPAVKITVGVLLLGLTLAGFSRLSLSNDIRSIYRISPALQADETLAAAILGHGSTGTFVIVEGTNAEETRRREESLLEELRPLKEDGALGDYLGSTQFLPSRQRQTADYALCAKYLRPAAAAQLIGLGFDSAAVKRWERDFENLRGQLMSADDVTRLPVGTLAQTLWLGEAEGRWYAAVMLFSVSDSDRVAATVREGPGRYLVNKVDEVNETLQRLSTTALLILAAAYAVILAGLIPRYRPAASAGIIFIPLLSSCVTVSLLTLCGVPFNLFIVMGLILVPGMGTDYVIFFTEGRRHPAPTVLAIFTSMLTTVFSFGLLMFTGLASGFGLTVGLGVLLSFCLTPLFMARNKTRPGPVPPT